jgi:hypothetical protein
MEEQAAWLGEHDNEIRQFVRASLCAHFGLDLFCIHIARDPI